MRLPEHIKIALIKIIEQEASDLKELRALDGLEKKNYSCDLDDEKFSNEVNLIREYFLSDPDAYALMHVNEAFSSSASQGEEKSLGSLNIALEGLIDMCAEELSWPLTRKSAADLVDEFQSRLGDPPVFKIYVPLKEAHRERVFERVFLQIDKHVQFGCFDLLERHYLAQENVRWRSFSKNQRWRLPVPDFGLRIEVPLSEYSQETKNQIRHAINAFAAYLRIFHDYNADLSCRYEGWAYPWTIWSLRSISQPREIDPTNTYLSFGEGSLAIFRKNWPELYPVTLRKYALSAGRLVDAESRESWRDKVVDIAVALESLVEGKGELRYRISTLVSCVVCQNPKDRMKIFKAMRTFYDLRSEIVHGVRFEDSNFKNKFSDMESVFTFIREIEGIIQKFLRIIVLNKFLQTNDGQTEFVLGVSPEIVLLPGAD